MNTDTNLYFLKASKEGFQEEGRMIASEVPEDIAMRDSYEFGDGDEEAVFMVWDIEIRHSDSHAAPSQHITLVRQYSRELH